MRSHDNRFDVGTERISFRHGENGDNSSTSHIKIKTGGNEQAVAEFRYMPAVAGVAVVCEGAGSVSVRSEVAEVVSGVLGIDRTLVSVAKRK